MHTYSENGTFHTRIESLVFSFIERILPLTDFCEWKSRTDLVFLSFLYFSMERHCITVTLQRGNFVSNRFRDSFDQQRVK